MKSYISLAKHDNTAKLKKDILAHLRIFVAFLGKTWWRE